MRKINLLIALCLGCLLLPYTVQARQKPRPPAEKRRKGESTPERPQKTDKWERSQRKGEFRRAVEGRTAERRKPDSESRPGGARNVEKASKWDRGQRKGEFSRAVEGRTAEKKRTDRDTRPDGGRRPVEKAEKWDRKNQIREKFNEAANPPRPPDGGSGGSKTGSGKGGGGAAAPPSGPKVKPPQPPQP